MAAAKKTAKASAPPAAAPESPAFKHHPVMQALSRAKSMVWLADKYTVEGLLSEPQLGPMKLDGDEVEDWVKATAMEAAAVALADLETELVKLMTTAPTSEPAR